MALILKRNFFALPTLFDLLMFPIFIFRKTYNWAVPLSNIISASERTFISFHSSSVFIYFPEKKRKLSCFTIFIFFRFSLLRCFEEIMTFPYVFPFFPCKRRSEHKRNMNEEIKIYAKHKNIKTFLYLFWLVMVHNIKAERSDSSMRTLKISTDLKCIMSRVV